MSTLKTKRRSRIQRARAAAQSGREFMTVKQTKRGWTQLFGPRRKTRLTVGRGWIIYGVLAHTDKKNKWFERWFPSLDTARAYAMKQDWCIDIPSEEWKWVKTEGGSKIERTKIK